MDALRDILQAGEALITGLNEKFCIAVSDQDLHELKSDMNTMDDCRYHAWWYLIYKFLNLTK